MKRSGQCDFGHCEKLAEVTLVVHFGGHVSEERPMCDAHADASIEVMGSDLYLTKEPLRSGSM